ncbi:MAG: ATP-binding protein [Balneolaceae bacterium]|nr:ATP-binding protein [Balneolaceae bacterium]
MPSAIEDYGLELSVEALIDQMKSASDISFHYTYDLENVKLSQQAQINLYRIIQEALSNAVKYAECTNLSLQLYKHGNIITCMIEDDGMGAPVDSLDNKKGMGIESMKSRVKALSGTIEFSSKPGKGLTILIELPLQVNKEK